MKIFFLFFYLLITTVSATEVISPFNFNDWPTEMKNKFFQEIPELLIQEPTDSDLNVILKKSYKLYPFENLKIIEKQNQYYLIGSLKSQIRSILFESGKADLNEELKELVLLTPQEAQNDSKIIQSQEKIVSILKNKGYRNPSVKYEITTQPDFNRDLTFKINHGELTRIQEIDIIGLPEQDKFEMNRKIYWGHVGEVLTDTELKSIYQSLRQQLSQRGYYLTTINSPQIFYTKDETKARLQYKLTGSLQTFKIEIKGSSSFSESYLLEDVLKIRDYFSTETNFGAELLEKIKLFYISKGFDLFDGTYFENKIQNKINLVFEIKENTPQLIHDIILQGQFSRPQSFYKDILFRQLKTKSDIPMVIRPDIETSLKNLIILLQNDGFISAQLNRWYIQKAPDSDKNFLIVHFNEGPETQLETIAFKENRFLNRNELLTLMDIKASQRINLDALEKSLIKIKNIYSENGFLEFKITTSPEQLISYNDDYTKARVLLEFSEGPQIIVGSITLQGNKLTHDKLILTELEFKNGDILTSTKIEESISRLQKTSYFSSVEITTLESFTHIKDRTVVVKVIERKPILLTTGIGATNENERTFHAYLGIANRNFGGWGRGISFRGDINYNDVFLKFLEHKLTAGYLEPYLFDTRTRFRVNYTTSAQVADINMRKQTISNSAVWSIEQDFTSHITGLWDLYNITTFVDKGIKPEDEIENDYTSQDFVIASTGPTLDIDYRDNLINPKKGHFSRFTVEYGSNMLGSHKVDDFLRTTGQSTLYLPFLNESVVWANSLRGGYLKPLKNTEVGIPFDKKGFILGGRSTLRGFEGQEFFPSTNENNPEALDTNYRLTSSTEYFLIKSELRFPLSVKNDLDAGLFYDGGRVLIEGQTFADEYRDSVGVGIRYNTPVGPLNLEYAHKLDKKPYESSGAFHLSVGVF